MKKIITSLMALSLIFGASAQDGMKGTYLLGATNDITTTGWSDIQIQPNVGYFVSDNIAVGTTLGFTSTNDKAGTAAGETTTSSTTIAPYVRYYMDSKLFFTGGFGMINTKSTTVTDGADDFENKGSQTIIGLGAGLSLMWGERVAVEPAFVLRNVSGKNEATGSDSMDMPSSLTVGFQIGLSLRM